MGSAGERILVVEDDADQSDLLVRTLERAGYCVRAVANGTEARAAAHTFVPDLVLLDVRLGDGPDGLSVARQLRTDSDLPFLMLTAADSPEDRLAGFDTGADDYVVKPIALDELLARVNVVIRRGRHNGHNDVYEIDDLVIDMPGRVVHRGGHHLDLTKMEFDLLEALARNRNRVITKDQLLADLWGYDGYDVNVVEVHVSGLRRKLEARGPRLIHTVRGVGYVLRTHA